MGSFVEIVTPLHKRTARDYLARMADDKVTCMKIAKEYGKDYWDGDRRYGYGGYRYDGRWKPVAEALIKRYGLTDGCSVLDVGCGKAHVLFELKKLLPNARLVGFDISPHGIGDAPEEIRPHLSLHRAQDPYPFKDKEFDLAISMAAFHNLRLFDLYRALGEFERVARQGYLMVESYRNELELFNLECWALTCESFFDYDEWVWLFGHAGYRGDYEFIYFE